MIHVLYFKELTFKINLLMYPYTVVTRIGSSIVKQQDMVILDRNHNIYQI